MEHTNTATSYMACISTNECQDLRTRTHQGLDIYIYTYSSRARYIHIHILISTARYTSPRVLCYNLHRQTATEELIATEKNYTDKAQPAMHSFIRQERKCLEEWKSEMPEVKYRNLDSAMTYWRPCSTTAYIGCVICGLHESWD